MHPLLRIAAVVALVVMPVASALAQSIVPTTHTLELMPPPAPGFRDRMGVGTEVFPGVLWARFPDWDAAN